MTRHKANRGANGKHGHHWIRDEKRARIYERDGYRCVWCGQAVTSRPQTAPPGAKFRPGEGSLATLDHVIGRNAGGTNEANNLVTCCLACNSKRKDRPAGEWLSYLHGGLGLRQYDDAVARLVLALASPLSGRPARDAVRSEV